jgi:UDP-2,3-diacylglucosamine hydrolase
MDRGAKTVVGILAGGGTLPREIADVLSASGQDPVIVGLEGEVRPHDFAGHDFTLVNWGRIGQLIRTFKSKGVTDLVIVGSVTRPDLRAIRTDLGFWTNLPRIYRIIKAGGDDSVLRRVVGFFEGHGFRVRGPAEVAPVLVIGAGAYGRVAMSEAARADFEIGRAVVARLAAFDVGQAVVVAGGEVLAIEGAEGTDAMLKRVTARRGDARGGVLVKWPKPGQELRVDMPAIGVNTIAAIMAAGLDGIAVQAGATLAAQRGDMLDAADAAGVFIAGMDAGAAERVTKTALPDDGAIGLALLDALAPQVQSRGAVVVRRHVLAVETGEGLADLVARAAGRRQWGKSKKRRGALAVRALGDLDQAVITAAADAGYERIVAAEDAPGIAERARAAGLAVQIGGRDA